MPPSCHQPLLLLLFLAASAAASASDGRPDLAELDRYLAGKLAIVANLSLASAESVSSVGGTVRLVYFGDHQADEASVFQSSLSLLALLPRYSPSGGGGVGFVDTATPAGERLRRRLGVRKRHSIVAFRGVGVRQEFHGFRNVQLLLDFVERLLTSAPRRLSGPRDKALIDRSGEAAVLLLTEAEAEPTAEWTDELAAMAVQLPTYVGVGRRLAGAFGSVPGCLLYHSPATATFASVRVRPGDSLRAALRRLRAESVLPLGPANLYLPAAESDDEDADYVGGRPLLVLLADPDGQAAAPAALALLKRLRRAGPPLAAAATLNPWRGGGGPADIDWAGILGGGVRLDRGPQFLLTTDRRLGGGGGGDGVFHLDGYRRLAEEAGAHEAALGDLRRWLRRKLGASGGSDEAEDQGVGRVEL